MVHDHDHLGTAFIDRRHQGEDTKTATGSVVLPTDLFTRTFRFPPQIRVQLDWDLVQRSHWPTRVAVAHGIDELSTCFFPWYLCDGREVPYSAEGAEIVSMQKLSRQYPALAAERRKAIELFAEELKGQASSVQLLLPAYSLGEGRHLFLDGCHRVAALARIDRPFTALLLSVEGPLDERILPDLRYWAPPSSE